MQVLQGKIDILSTNGLDAALAPAPTTPGSIKAFCPETDPIVQYVSQQMEQYVKQMKDLAEEMQNALQHISDELATEVGREQQHLMLMQDQVQSCLRAPPALLAMRTLSACVCACVTIAERDAAIRTTALPAAHPAAHIGQSSCDCCVHRMLVCYRMA